MLKTSACRGGQPPCTGVSRRVRVIVACGCARQSQHTGRASSRKDIEAIRSNLGTVGARSLAHAARVGERALIVVALGLERAVGSGRPAAVAHAGRVEVAAHREKPELRPRQALPAKRRREVQVVPPARKQVKGSAAHAFGMLDGAERARCEGCGSRARTGLSTAFNHRSAHSSAQPMPQHSTCLSIAHASAHARVPQHTCLRTRASGHVHTSAAPQRSGLPEVCPRGVPAPEATRSNQKPSEAIRSNQKQSEAIRRAHARDMPAN